MIGNMILLNGYPDGWNLKDSAINKTAKAK